MKSVLFAAWFLGLAMGTARAQDPQPWTGPLLRQQQSGPWTVGHMLEACRAFIKRGDPESDPAKALDEGICGGFFSGLMFYSWRLPEALRFCPPDTVTVREAVFLVITQVDKRPELLSDDIRTVSPLALQVDWPCK
jgi:Rap1a immunity proteins